jgi:branched-chain amino acid transport system substrate-binding protein
MRGRRVVIAITSSLVLSVSACGLGSGTGGNTGATSGPIVIGISEPLTGDKADVGTNSQSGYQVWAKTVNDSGGLLGRQVKLIIYDNNSLADTTTSQYERLVTQDKVNLLLGPFSSALTVPASAVAEKYHTVFVEGSGGAPEVFSRHFHYLFFTQPAPIERQADPLVAWIKSLPADQRPKVAAYPQIDDPFTTAVEDAAQSQLEASGIKTAYKQLYPPTQTDFTSVGAQLKSMGADLLVMGTVADQDSIGAVKSYATVGYEPKIAYFTSGPDSADTWSAQLGQKGDGAMTSLAWLQESKAPGNDQFVKAYLKMFPNPGSVVPSEAAEAYSAGQVLASAVKGAGTVDNKTLASWLHGHRVQSVEGMIGWDADGRPQGGSYQLLQWQNGKLVVVWPAALATNGAKPAMPKAPW